MSNISVLPQGKAIQLGTLGCFLFCFLNIHVYVRGGKVKDTFLALGKQFSALSAYLSPLEIKYLLYLTALLNWVQGPHITDWKNPVKVGDPIL